MSAEPTCYVCQQPVTDRRLLADCDACDQLYHLNPRSDVEGIDCGTVWAADDDSMALQFLCQPCLDVARGPQPTEGVQPAPDGTPTPPSA